MKPEDLKIRTKNFAHNCVKIAFDLPDKFLGKHVQNQLIRCSTSVAANYHATCLSQSKRTFISKISIVVEEIDEVCFWLDFIVEEHIGSEDLVHSINLEAKELTAIFVASRKTAKNNLNHSTIVNNQ